MSERFIVSPYLQAIPTERLAGFWPVVPDETVRKELSERAERDEARLLFDALLYQVLAVSKQDAELLGKMSSDRDATPLRTSDPATFERFAKNGLVMSFDEAFKRHAYKSIEIEVNRHCNYRCGFCPVEASPKPRGFMAPETFQLVIERASEYGAIMISLNHYSEPTLDPNLIDKLKAAGQIGLWIRLHTNASLLDEEKIKAIAEVGNTFVIVNMPSVDKATYEKVTGAKMFDRVIDNLKNLHKHGVNVQLSVNTPKETADSEVLRINEMFSEMFGPSVRWPTDSRSGRVDKPEYAIPVTHTGVLSGCGIAIQQMNVSYEGNAFLCCQDFDQEHLLGDLRTHSIKEIAESDRAVQLRRWIFGGEEAPSGFICTGCEWTQPAARQPALSVGHEAKRDHLALTGLHPELLTQAPVIFAI